VEAMFLAISLVPSSMAVMSINNGNSTSHYGVDTRGYPLVKESHLGPKQVTPPTIQILTPADKASLNGNASIVVACQDVQGLKSLVILVDGTQLAAKNFSNVLDQTVTTTFDTTRYTDGAHDIMAMVSNVVNITANQTITVTIANQNRDYTVVIVIVVVAMAVVAALIIKLAPKSRKTDGNKEDKGPDQDDSSDAHNELTERVVIHGEHHEIGD
jgi:hypothetical protein